MTREQEAAKYAESLDHPSDEFAGGSCLGAVFVAFALGLAVGVML